MSKDKCCGNCKYFKNEDADGWGTCEFQLSAKCDDKCGYHSFINNGWTEITPDTESNITEELAERIIIGCIDCCGEMHTAPLVGYYIGIGTMAKIGGYYYYVLPELKIE